MSTKAIPYTEVDVSKIVLADPKLGEKGNMIKYYDTNITYNFGTDEERRLGKFKIESPILTIRKGIGKMEDPMNAGKEPNYTLYAELNLLDPDHNNFFNKMFEIHSTYKTLIAGNDKLVDVKKFKPEEDPSAGYESPFKYPRISKESQERDRTKNPAMSFKLNRFYKPDANGNKKITYETKFVDPMGKKLSWESLEGKAFECLIVIEELKLFKSSNKHSPIYEQRYADSVIVTKFLKDTNSSVSDATRESIKQRFAQEFEKSKQETADEMSELSMQTAELSNPLDFQVPDTPVETYSTE